MAERAAAVLFGLVDVCRWIRGQRPQGMATFAQRGQVAIRTVPTRLVEGPKRACRHFGFAGLGGALRAPSRD